MFNSNSLSSLSNLRGGALSLVLLAFLLGGAPRSTCAQSGLPSGLFSEVEVHTDATATDYAGLEEDALTFYHASGDASISWDGATLAFSPFPTVTAGTTTYGADLVFDTGGDDATLSYDNSGDILDFTETLAASRFLSDDGTAAAVGHGFTSDVGLGLYWAAADSMGVAANGSQVALFTTSGLSINTSGSLTVGDIQLTDTTNTTHVFMDAGGSLSPSPELQFDNDDGAGSPDPRFSLNYPTRIDDVRIEDELITFDTGGDGELLWDSGNTRFDLSNPLNLQGTTGTDGLYIAGVVTVDGTRKGIFTTATAAGFAQSTALAIALTVDDQDIDVGSANLVTLSSNGASAADRTFTLDGSTPTQRLVTLVAITSNMELIDDGGTDSNVVALAGDWTPGANDTLTLAWEPDADQWVEVARSNN